MSAHPLLTLLNGFGRAETRMGFQRSIGELLLDIHDPASVAQLSEEGMSAAQLLAAEKAFEHGRSVFDASDPEPSIAVMRALTHTYPLWGKGHIAMVDVMLHLGRLEDAVYHLSQYLVLHTDSERFAQLGQLLMQLERPSVELRSAVN